MIIPMSQMRSRGSERFINLPEDTQQGRARASEGWSSFWVTFPPVLANGELPVPLLLKAPAPAGCPEAGSPASTAGRLGIRTQSPRRSSSIRLRVGIQAPEHACLLPALLPLSSASPGGDRLMKNSPLMSGEAQKFPWKQNQLLLSGRHTASVCSRSPSARSSATGHAREGG